MSDQVEPISGSILTLRSRRLSFPSCLLLARWSVVRGSISGKVCGLPTATHDGLTLLPQVFEVDKALLQQHALPLLATYKYSEPYMLRALRMDEHLPFPGDVSALILDRLVLA